MLKRNPVTGATRQGADLDYLSHSATRQGADLDYLSDRELILTIHLILVNEPRPVAQEEEQLLVEEEVLVPLVRNRACKIPNQLLLPLVGSLQRPLLGFQKDRAVEEAEDHRRRCLHVHK